MRLLLTLLVTIGCGTALAQETKVNAEAAATLVTQNFCNACHDVEKKMLGPTFKDIAAKYKADKDAPAMLLKKVKRGGAGVWGQVPMPANEGVKDDDLKTIIAWVLSL